MALYGGVGASRVSTQQSLAVHLGLEAGDVAAAEVFAQVAHLLQFQQVDPQHLDGLHHLQVNRHKGPGLRALMVRNWTFNRFRSLTDEQNKQQYYGYL